jgi:hypothetical protein
METVKRKDKIHEISQNHPIFWVYRVIKFFKGGDLEMSAYFSHHCLHAKKPSSGERCNFSLASF